MLYKHLGWNAPFIFTIIICAVDLFLRLLVIEQKDLPDSMRKPTITSVPAADVEKGEGAVEPAETLPPIEGNEAPKKQVQRRTGRMDPADQLPLADTLSALLKSRRGVAGFLVTFIYGLVIGAIDPTWVRGPRVRRGSGG